VREGKGQPANTVFIDAVYDRKNRIVDLGVVVLGGPANDNIDVYGSPGNIKVVGAGLVAGEGCAAIAAGEIRCAITDYLAAHAHRKSPFHYILVYGDAGDDTIRFFGDFPRELEVHASGGPGNDHLIGGDEQDIFFTGPDGNDWLEGGDGDDALISESHHIGDDWKDGARPDVSKYHDGADRLDGGPGNDQLVADYVCGGHRFIGGPGHDIAGFARSGNNGIWAQLGGVTSPAHQTQWYGFAANMTLCGNVHSAWTSWRTGSDADLEVLEASDGPDHLWGSDQNDTIWAAAAATTSGDSTATTRSSAPMAATSSTAAPATTTSTGVISSRCAGSSVPPSGDGWGAGRCRRETTRASCARTR
jgi:Ca2+-binding RTX toxin-like protein